MSEEKRDSRASYWLRSRFLAEIREFVVMAFVALVFALILAVSTDVDFFVSLLLGAGIVYSIVRLGRRRGTKDD